MKHDFLEKKVLITGGTKGLGLATAQMFLQAGAEVWITFRSDIKNATKVHQELGGRCHLIQCDLTEDGSVEKLFTEIRKSTNDLDVLVYNAAATAFKNLLDLKAHHIDKTFALSVKSFLLSVQEAASMMKNGGAIIPISGMDTLKAVPQHGLLAGAKAALETLTAYLAQELAPLHIRVNSVNPGFFDSEGTRKLLGPAFEIAQARIKKASPFKRIADPHEIAEVILFLTSSSARWIAGQTIVVDGGFDFSLPLFDQTQEKK